jgi:hypothetical protein
MNGSIVLANKPQTLKLQTTAEKIWTGYRDKSENFEAWINITVMAAFDLSEISRFQIRLW